MFEFFRGEKYTSCLVAITNNLMSSCIITTNIQKALKILMPGPLRGKNVLVPGARPILGSLINYKS